MGFKGGNPTASNTISFRLLMKPSPKNNSRSTFRPLESGFDLLSQ
jgi:hypothetical protein